MMPVAPVSGIDPAKASGIDRPFLVAVVTAGALLGFVTWDQSFWWRSLDDYRFGWLAPAFVVYAFARRWPAVGNLVGEIRLRGAATSTAASRGARAIEVTVGIGFGLALLLFLFGAMSRGYAGPSHPGSLAIALGAGGMILTLIYLTVAAGLAGRNTPAVLTLRRRLVAFFLYPALVWLVTTPLLVAWEARLSPLLLRQLEGVVVAVFHLFHLPVALQGNVFVLRGGPVSLEAACLGLRSITGCLFGGLFLAEVCLTRHRLQAVLIGAALALALLMNLARVLFLNLWAHKFGPLAIAGTMHDATGWAVLPLTAALLFLLTTRLERLERRPPNPGAS